jgi:alanyl aminopeptidase
MRSRGRGRELAFALAAGNEMLVALERWMGIPYPYDKLDHLAASEFFAGAMENAGAILYRDSLLLVDPAHPDQDRMARVAAVMAHEMAHQWFGNLVTLPWWTEAWLNESFAQFLGVRIADALHPAWGLGMRQIRLVDSVMVNDALTSARAIRQPLCRSEEIWDQFDGLTYQKGMAVLATFERWLGAEPFRQGLRSYIAAHADGTGSTEALLAAWSQSAGRDVSGPFLGFVDRPGVPLVAVETQCGDGARARFTQRRHALRGASAPGGAWEIPVCVRFQAQGPPWMDERLRPQERLDPVLLPERPAAMRRVFRQIVASLDEMIPLLPAGAEGELPHAASGFCDAAQLAEARRFLERAVSRHPSMRQGSAKVLERIEACIAERASDRQAAGAWFARWAR